MTPDSTLQLYTYFRSSAAYRVRIALNLKGLDWQSLPINLATGEQRSAEYLKHNPQGFVPALHTAGGLISQSLAIIEYLDECYPQPPLLPDSAIDRATVRSMAQQIAMDIHPLNNLRVTQYLTAEMGVDEAGKLRWYQHWIAQGFTAFEESLRHLNSTGQFCFGDSPTVADICLIPQVSNALRFSCPLESYPTINSIYQYCTSLPAFISASPQAQPDFPAP
jgi:maleylpyruvate isomerase